MPGHGKDGSRRAEVLSDHRACGRLQLMRLVGVTGSSGHIGVHVSAICLNGIDVAAERSHGRYAEPEKQANGRHCFSSALTARGKDIPEIHVDLRMGFQFVPIEIEILAGDRSFASDSLDAECKEVANAR